MTDPHLKQIGKILFQSVVCQKLFYIFHTLFLIFFVIFKCIIHDMDISLFISIGKCDHDSCSKTAESCKDQNRTDR